MTDKTAMEFMGQSLRLFVYDWHKFDAVKTFAPLADRPYSIFLDSHKPQHPLNNYSYICFDPFETISSKDGRVIVTNKDNRFDYKRNPFRVVRERLSMWGDYFQTKKNIAPFQGGVCGYFGYDLARGLENIPSSSLTHNQPDMCIGIYHKIVAFDNKTNKAYLMIHAKDEDSALREKNSLESLVSSYSSKESENLDISWKTEKTDEQFTSDIAKVVEYINAGDIFQANVSRRFIAKLPDEFDKFLHYQKLRNVNGAPYGAYMNFDGITLSSCSPERFLSVMGKTIETRPIKGTLPSYLPSKQLEESQKDRAENIMIVDLLRNDLSKVCEDHSVTVKNLCAIETFEGLHHMVSTVSANLRADMTGLDALCACFPGGSITGAPKIRSMEIIDELEPHRRGAYCGAMGYIGFDGVMDTAITIRTLVYCDGEVQIQTGGGITAQSIPKQELDETLVKAQKLFESFDTTGVWKDKKIA